jgi:hypothetical protein
MNQVNARPFARSLFVVVMTLVSLAAPARAQWSAQSLFTEDGVEVGVDARVFALFAMMNGIGFDADERLGPAPLFRPQYSAARAKIRQSLGRRGSSQKALEEVIAKNPQPIGDYLAAALELGPPPSFDAPKGASPLAKAIAGPMGEWFADEGGAGTLRIAAEEVKPTQKRLLPALDKAIKATTKLIRLGDAQDQLLDDSGPQGKVVVVINELDRHGTYQIVTRGDATYVVTGSLEAAHDARVVHAATLAYARTLVSRDVQKIGPGTLADGLLGKLDERAKGKLSNDKAAAAELLACAFTRKVHAGVQTACMDSPIAAQTGLDAGTHEALAARVDAYAGTTAALSVALPDLLAPIPPAAVAPETPPADPKGKGKKGGK